MELKRYKLGEIAEIQTGPFGSQLHNEDYVQIGTPIVTVEHLGQKEFTTQNLPLVSDADKERLHKYVLRRNDIVFSRVGTVDRCSFVTQKEDGWLFSGRCLRVRPQSNIYAEYLYYLLCTNSIRDYIRSKAVGATMPSLNTELLFNIPITLPSLSDQRRIASVLSNIDKKIALNRQINTNLEALARQLYDYWFVQFDFPDANGNPYKSSGGKMVYNEKLKREIPDGWNICQLNEYILSNNTGDWGKDAISDGYFEVGCIRGADILSLIDLPKRYIKNEEKLLSEHDIVIEVSGGSPTQATGRSAYISQGVIERNGGRITCSNFCHAFTLKDVHKAPFFYYTWRLFYDNGNMFNFEGKTSGIKNFMTEMFLKNCWIDAPQNLVNDFFNKVSAWFALIDTNIAEISSLTRQRDELLPLLMNGQVTV